MCTITNSVYKTVGVPFGNPLPSYTGIGCYTIIYYTRKEEPLCGRCATKHSDSYDPVSHAGTYDEGPSVECSNCGKEIESSYGDPRETDAE